ncbi:amidohydrolase family protein [Thermodesulfobacteriota bacterium]
MEFDIVVHNGTIVTMNPDAEIIDNGVICIKEGKLEKIYEQVDDSGLPQAVEAVDAGGGIVMPGLVNAHTHLPMTLFRGLADDLPLQVWLNEHIFPAEAKHVNPESARIGSLLGCAEAILSGTTTCCDGYFYEDSVALAVRQAGLRAILGHGVIDFPAPGVPDPGENVQHALAYTEKWKGAVSTITPSIFCHSPYTCAEATLRKAKETANSFGVLFQIHVAETTTEIDRSQAEQRMTPVQYLDRIGVLDKNTLLVHAVWVDDNDTEIIAESNATVAHCPESNMKLASGIAPIPAFIAAGVKVGLGSDGCASNNNLDLFQEMDFTAKLHKVKHLDPTVMDAPTVLRMATIEGAKAIGLDREIGSLEIGKQADLIIIDTNSPHLTPMYNPISHIVYAAQGPDVRDVIVAGRWIMRDRRLLTLDLGDLLEKVNALSQSIKEQKIHNPN